MFPIRIFYPQRLINQFLDIIFPKVCIGCHKFTDRNDFYYICRSCFGKIKLKNSFECVGCKRQTTLGLTCAFCKKENSLDQLIITADFTDPTVEKMLKVYKYSFISDMAKPISILARKNIKKLLSKGFNLFEGNPLIIAVPLHKIRLNKRGFNQSQLITENISDVFHMSYVENILRKIHNSKNQADIKVKEERLKNVRSNFIFNKKYSVNGKIIILVDDICTTGATLNECARVLKENGAKRVIGFVIARG